MSNKIKRDWLIRARKLKGMTQDDVARFVGITPAAVCHYEVGLRDPKPAVALKIANLLRVPKERFFWPV